MVKEEVLESPDVEAYAYTPGLKIKRSITIKKVRRLPIPGEVLVKTGDEVDYGTAVARVDLPGKPYIVKAAAILNIDSDELPPYMVKRVGDRVVEGEVIAQSVSFFGLMKKFVHSPVKGTIEIISDATGRVTVREPSVPVELNAYIPGRVVEVMPCEGVVVETEAAFLQGIFGIGGESHGEIVMLADSPEDVLTDERITPKHRGKILVAGALVTRKALRKAAENAVSGVVSGGIEMADLTDLLGYQIGVAITGEEEVGLTLVIVEGFGRMAMSARTFNLLKGLDGQMAHISGATQIRAGVLRPEIIIPHQTPESRKEEAGLEAGMRPGTPIRVIQNPYFGEIGTVVSLPAPLQKIETESYVRVVEVKLENGEHVIVPRANVEIIEE